MKKNIGKFGFALESLQKFDLKEKRVGFYIVEDIPIRVGFVILMWKWYFGAWLMK